MTEIEVEIEEEKENKFLNRRELNLIAYHSGESTPTRDEITGEISDLVGASKDTIIVDSINSEFGKNQSKISARVYDDKDSVVKYENDYSLERNKIQGD